MQKTRQKILEYLKRHQQATVDELSRVLDDLTAVTVRHHLDVLRREELVAPPEIVHRDGPGRPKYAYRLTDKAEALFPRNLDTLTSHMLDEMKRSLAPQQINVIFEGVAEQMAADLERAAAPSRTKTALVKLRPSEKLKFSGTALARHGLPGSDQR